MGQFSYADHSLLDQTLRYVSIFMKIVALDNSFATNDYVVV